MLKLPAFREQDSVHGLRMLYDQINTHIGSLSTLGVASEHYGPMLSSIILEKLPQEIKLKFLLKSLKQEKLVYLQLESVRILNLTVNIQAQRYIPLLHLEAKTLLSHL